MPKRSRRKSVAQSLPPAPVTDHEHAYLAEHFAAWEEELFQSRDRDRDEWLAKEQACDAT